MGKHFVTVCVFCLLCATHTPCSSHVQFSIGEKHLDDGQMSAMNDTVNSLPMKKTVFDKITDRFSPTTPPLRHDTVSEHLTSISVNNNINKNPSDISVNKNKQYTGNKRKRDVHRKHKFDEAVYIEKIFKMFGDGETMNYAGFERLIKSLHLDRLLWSKINNSMVNLASASVNHLAVNRINNDTTSTCMDHRDLLASVTNTPALPAAANGTSNTSRTEPNVTVDDTALRRLCPVLLYQLVAQSSTERQGCIVVTQQHSAGVDNTDSDTGAHSANTQAHNNNNNNNDNDMTSVWLYSTLSIIIISACGLLGVLVIPIMQQHFYQHLIQFLVALAIGTLAGDALIHLLPHAMMSHSHGHDGHNHADDEDQHTKNMWRGFVAMIGLIFFFFMEKCLTLCAEWRKERQLRKNKVPARVRVMRETDTASTTSVGCKHKYSSYPYCYGVIATETQDDHHNRQHAHNHNSSNSNMNDTHNNTTTTILTDMVDSESEFLAKQPQEYLVKQDQHQQQQQQQQQHPAEVTETNQNMSKCTNNSRNMKCSESNKMLAEHADTHTLQDFPVPKPEISESESYTVILRTHETKHHGHSHTHGHVHSAPSTLSSVAWMVVMGDGLHNFTDGMAIGAAFAGSLAGGFSTAVAVFCHELPHEIGDFAVLLKAGMTARQAIFYNLLSSILCLFGMVLGVFLGNNDSASSWLFACAAGMFLYIALVDMIPELTTSHSSEGGSLLQCVLQFIGLLIGLGIMLLIAMYEHDLKQLFDD